MAARAHLFHLVLHAVQLAGAVAAVVLYSATYEGITKNRNWTYVLTISAFSIAGVVIQSAARFCLRGMAGIGWCVLSGLCSGLLFLFWTAVVGIFAKAYIHLDANGNHGIKMMQIAVYVDIGNMVIWFLTVVDMIVVFGFLVARQQRNNLRANPNVAYTRPLSPSFTPHGWNDEDIEDQTRAVENEHPSVRASLVMQEVRRSLSNPPRPHSIQRIGTNEKAGLESVSEAPPLLPDDLQDFWEVYSHLFGPLKECQICCEQRPCWTGFPIQISQSCSNHEQDACNQCVDKWIATELESSINGPIHCSQCRAVLDYAEIRNLASPETFTRYERMAIRGFVNNDPNFVWCQNRGCTSGQEHIGGTDQPIVTCLACGFRTCFKHQIPWHEEMLCDEYDERAKTTTATGGRQTKKEQELASLAVIHKSTRPCGNKSCKAPIFKDEGCDHMKCWRCKQEFCWVCGGDWKKGSHRTGCPFNRA